MDVEELVSEVEDDPSSVTVADIEPFLSDDDEITRKRALDVCQAVAVADSERLLPLTEELLEFATDDFLAIKHAALATIGHMLPDEAEAFADGFEALIGQVDGETPQTRFLAAKSVALFTGQHPELATDYVTELLAAIDQDGPTVPDEVRQPSFGPDSNDPIREKIAEEHGENENARELAAKTLAEVGKTEPDAIAPHAPAIVENVADPNQIVSGAFVSMVSILASEGYDLPEDTVDRIESVLPEGGTQLQARSLRALGYLNATESIDMIRDVAGETDDRELAEFAKDTAEWLESTAEE